MKTLVIENFTASLVASADAVLFLSHSLHLTVNSFLSDINFRWCEGDERAKDGMCNLQL